MMEAKKSNNYILLESTTHHMSVKSHDPKLHDLKSHDLKSHDPRKVTM